MANDKTKRDREWKARENFHDSTTPWPAYDSIADNAGKVDKAKFDLMVKWIYQWARDMNAWGQDMRDDMIRLEGQAGFPSGDPGDPPGGPPE